MASKKSSRQSTGAPSRTSRASERRETPARSTDRSSTPKTRAGRADGAVRARRARSSAAPLPAGRRAPDFTLCSTPDQTVSLSDFRGRPVILAFYPADWSPVCGDQLALYNEVLPEFQRHGAELLGISVDGVWCHAAFAKQRHFHFPLLADFEPKGAVAGKYGVYDAKNGFSNRALFVLDPRGVIHWSYLSPLGVNPGADGIIGALESMGLPPAQPAAAGTAGTIGRVGATPGAARGDRQSASRAVPTGGAPRAEQHSGATSPRPSAQPAPTGSRAGLPEMRSGAEEEAR